VEAGRACEADLILAAALFITIGERGISAAVVYPMGVVDTPGNRGAMPDADRSAWIDPAEIARGLLAAVWVPGPTI
jgi:hypothetical protein